MSMLKTLVLAAGMTAALTSTAFAAPATDGSIVMNCAQDIKKFCTDAKYSKQKIRVCLEAQKDKLTQPCKDELAKK
jgi:hypothetical protein